MLSATILALFFAVIYVSNGYRMKPHVELNSNKNPFTINLGKERTVTVNLDKLLPPNVETKDRDQTFGDVRLGILHKETECVEILHDEPIPYLRSDGLYSRVPVTYTITHEQFSTLLDNNPLVIIRMHTQKNKKIKNPSGLQVCRDQPHSKAKSKFVDVLVEEDLHKTVSVPGESQDDRCNSQYLQFDENPGQDIPYFANAQIDPMLYRFGLSPSATIDLVPEGIKFIKRHPKRPLFGYASHSSLQALLTDEPTCNLSSLQTQLQTAIELEWSTLPLYLTAQFSIISNENTGAYKRIFNVSIQEMLHMAQAANLVIAVGAVPIINASTAPTYPRTGLPGGVLQNLEIPLTKLTIDQAYNTFMGIEIPNNSSAVYPPLINDLYTIGAFYNETLECIEELGDEIFQNPSGDQVVHDFGQFGTLYTVTSVDIAREAIEQIVEQGEGESPVNPTQINSDEYAHFYKFEEIVCQNALVQVSENQYAYQGEAIPYNAEGVYTMIDNPNKNTIQPGTECYEKAKAFNSDYVKMIGTLEKAFTEDSSLINTAISEMFALPSSAGDTFQVPASPGSPYKCGPVWDMDFQ